MENMDQELLSLAKETKQEVGATPPIPDDVEVEVLDEPKEEPTEPEEEPVYEEPESPKEEEECVFLGFDDEEYIPTPDPSAVPGNEEFHFTEEELRGAMPSLDPETFDIAVTDIKQAMEQQKHQLLLAGFNPAEYTIAMKNAFERYTTDKEKAYREDHPDKVILSIDKTAEDSITFTKEEEEKIERSKSIHLVLVENQELESITLAPIPKKSKAAYIRTMKGYMSEYSMPLVATGDYSTFRGIQMVQLASLYEDETSTAADILARKSSIIYDCYVDGTILHKTSDDNKVLLSQREFGERFLFEDVNLGMYAILCATVPENKEISALFTCTNPECLEESSDTFNMRSLLHLNDISPYFMGRMDSILENKASVPKLEALNAEIVKTVRLRSPITKNIYDFAHPSINRAQMLIASLPHKREEDMMLLNMAMYFSSVFVYNKDMDGYLELGPEEYELSIEHFKQIPQEEWNMLNIYIRDHEFSPSFLHPFRCPICGQKTDTPISLDILVFLAVRDYYNGQM